MHLQAEIEPVARGSLNILEGMLELGLAIMTSLTGFPLSSPSSPGGGPVNPRRADLELWTSACALCWEKKKVLINII